MRRIGLAFLLLALPFTAMPARAGILISVDKSAQQLTVDVDGATQHRWPVSTARWGYNTPNGLYRPQRLERQWYSHKYNMSPMPYSIFFAGGYAIHGSNEISRLGRPASHGCIRLHPQNAALLFDLVKRNPGAVRIEISGGRPGERSEPIAEYSTPRRVGASRQVEFRPRHRLVRKTETRHRIGHAQKNFEEVFRDMPRHRSSRAAQRNDL